MKQKREKFIYTQNLEGCRPYWYTQFFFSEKFSVWKNDFDKILSKLELFYPGSYIPASNGEAELLEGEIVTSLWGRRGLTDLLWSRHYL